MSPLAKPDFRWTQDDWGDGAPPAGPSPLRQWAERHGWLVRGAIVLVALILFELTANAALATAASCLELGRTDFATALWLWRVDPDRRRGRFNALCYWAWACCRVGFMALGVLMLIPTLSSLANGGQPVPQPPPHMMGALLVMLGAFAVGALLSFVACFAALLCGRKVWLGPEPKLARRQGIWPPSLALPERPGTNRAKVLFHLAWSFVVVPGLIVVLFACLLDPKNTHPLILLGLVALMLVGVVALITTLERRILARNPAECWPLGEPVTTRVAPNPL